MSFSRWILEATEHLNQVSQLTDTRIQRKNALSRGSPSSLLTRSFLKWCLSMVSRCHRDQWFLIHLRLEGRRKGKALIFHNCPERYTVLPSHLQYIANLKRIIIFLYKHLTIMYNLIIRVRKVVFSQYSLWRPKQLHLGCSSSMLASD